MDVKQGRRRSGVVLRSSRFESKRNLPMNASPPVTGPESIEDADKTGKPPRRNGKTDVVAPVADQDVAVAAATVKEKGAAAPRPAHRLTLGRSELAYEVRRAAGLTPQQAEAAVKAIEAAVRAALTRGESVRLAGIGTLALKPVPARAVRNPRTGETLDKPESVRPHFALAQTLKEAAKPG
jgi:DNA-binding protein HU-beta